METLLAQGMPVTIQDLRTLALHRAAVTRNFLIERGGIAANRLPLGPARVEEPGDKKPPGQTYFTIEAEARAR
jgi:hypothetical protein